MNYKDIQKKARKSLSQYGTPATLFHPTGESIYNAVTNSYEKNGVTTSGYVIVSGYDAEKIDGTNIKAEDVSLLCSFSQTPINGDEIRLSSGKQYSVITVKPVSPNGTDVLVTRVQAR